MAERLAVGKRSDAGSGASLWTTHNTSPPGGGGRRPVGGVLRRPIPGYGRLPITPSTVGCADTSPRGEEGHLRERTFYALNPPFISGT
jgi:hypothetical protein